MAKMQQERHILVLGASGKLGRMLRRHWRTAPPGEFSTHWQHRENPEEGGWVWQPGESVPPGLPPITAILALWGATAGSGRDLADNSRLARAALDLAAALGAERVLHCSSAAVYPPGPAPLSEDAAGGAVGAYGAAKLAMEDAIADWSAAHPAGPASCAMRIANVVGADSLFAAVAGGDGTLTLDRFENGEGPWRSYVSVPSLAAVVRALVTCPLGQLPKVVNVAAPDPMSMESLARAAGCDINWRTAPETAAPMVALDTRRLSDLITLPRQSPDDLIAGWRTLGARS